MSQIDSGYDGSRPLQRGTYAAPIMEFRDRRGNVRWRECAGCGQRIYITDKECGGCGVALLGREVVVRS